MIDDSVLKPITELGEMENHGCLPLDWLCAGVGLVWWGNLEAAQGLNLYFLFPLSDSWVLFFPFVTYKNVCLPQGHFLGFCPSNPPPGVTLLSGNSVACSGGFTRKNYPSVLSRELRPDWHSISHASKSKSKPGGGSGNHLRFPFVQAIMTASPHTAPNRVSYETCLSLMDRIKLHFTLCPFSKSPVSDITEKAEAGFWDVNTVTSYMKLHEVSSWVFTHKTFRWRIIVFQFQQHFSSL